jgi:hypothetical protein
MTRQELVFNKAELHRTAPWTRNSHRELPAVGSHSRRRQIIFEGERKFFLKGDLAHVRGRSQSFVFARDTLRHHFEKPFIFFVLGCRILDIRNYPIIL